MSPLDRRLAAALAALGHRGLRRERRAVAGGAGAEVEVAGRRCLNFCSNDYLGLAGDPRVADAAQRVLADWGTGSTASALVCGYHAEHRALEEELAAFCGRPRALLFASGWAANLGVLRALLGRDDVLVADELNHASLIDGGRLSGARYLRVPHRDVAAFARMLREAAGGRGAGKQTVVATDSVFSMDGDVAPLGELSTLAAAHEAALMVDDAHGFGILGATGRGAWELASPAASSLSPPAVYVATLGKALGVAGAFVAGSAELIEFLVQRARPYVYSTAPPPALAAAARAALGIAQAEGERRTRLHDNVRRLRTGAAQLGIPLPAPGAPSTPIHPLVLGSEARAMALSQWLLERGCWVTAIRPPTVPAGTARLRITVTAAHSAQQVDRLLESLDQGLQRLRPAA